MLTINQVKLYLIGFFENHLQINTVVYDSDFNFNAEDDLLYKVVQIQPIDPVQVTYNEAVYKFKVVVADIIDPANNDSENDIQSDCISIANDFISYFGDEDFQDFFIDKNINIQTFTEKNGDRIAGCVFAFGVRQTRLFNPCSIPLGNPFTGVSFSGFIAESNPYYNLLAPYLTIVSASTLYQPKGDYISGTTVDFSDYYTREQANALFLTGYTVNLSDYYTIEQTNAKFLTGYTPDLSDYYTKELSDSKYQLIGNYVSASTLANYQLAGNYVSASTLNNYQLAGNYVSASTLANYQPTGSYVSASTLSNYLTASQISAAYQVIGNYVSASTLLSYQLAGNYVSASTLANYQLVGNYVSASTLGSYLTAAQISSAYQVIGNYVSASTLSNYQLSGDYVSASTLANYQLVGNYVSASTLSQYQTTLNLTTSGSSGAATFDGTNLNIPQYAGTTYTTANGISLTGNTIGLGGTLIQNTSTEMSGHTFKFSDTVGTDKFTVGNGLFNVTEGVSGTGYSYITVSHGAFNAVTYIANSTDNFNFFCNSSSLSLNYAQNSSGTSKQISVNPTSISIYDTVNLKGMVYSADYSTNGKADNRWIPDWGTIKNYVSGITGTTIILSTSGSSGAATLNGGYLNIPQYTGAFANPTASVGLAVVNGSATTYMRADAAPAIDQSIAPTWTGTHTFSVTNTASATATTNVGTLIKHTLNQSGAANFTDLLVNRISTSAGTGTQLLLDLQVGGSSRLSVNSGGYLQATGGATLGATQFQVFNQNNSLTDGAYLWNTASSTSSKPVVPSLSVRWQGSVWNTTATAAANYFSYINYATGVSGNTPTSTLVWAGSLTNSFSTPSYSTIMSLSSTGILTLQAPVVTKGYTVSTLPTGVQGMMCYVTDSNSTSVGVVVSGSGSNVKPVFYNGTNWVTM